MYLPDRVSFLEWCFIFEPILEMLFVKLAQLIDAV
jgi:hypothetical protein